MSLEDDLKSTVVTPEKALQILESLAKSEDRIGRDKMPALSIIWQEIEKGKLPKDKQELKDKLGFFGEFHRVLGRYEAFKEMEVLIGALRNHVEAKP